MNLSWARDNLLASRQRQRDNVIEMLRSRCLNGVVAMNIEIMPTILWSENRVTMSRLCCRVPSTDGLDKIMDGSETFADGLD